MPATELTIALAGGVGVASGALLTVASSLWGQRREARREQGRWFRDQRLDAYVDFERAASAVIDGWHAHDRVRKRLAGNDQAPMQEPKPAPDPLPLWSDLHVTAGRIALVGPTEVEWIANWISSALFFCWEHSVKPPADLFIPFSKVARWALTIQTLRSRLLRRHRPPMYEQAYTQMQSKILRADSPFHSSPRPGSQNWPTEPPTDTPTNPPT